MTPAFGVIFFAQQKAGGLKIAKNRDRELPGKKQKLRKGVVS